MDTSTSLLCDVYTDSLAPLTTVISLGECLAEHEYISTDIVDKLVLLEGEKGIGLTEAKKLLVTQLMTLGPAKVGEIKKTLREFVKARKDVIEALDVKVPPSLISMSVPNERDVVSGGVVSEKNKAFSTRKSGCSELEIFSQIFYTFLQKFLTSYAKSSTLKTRLHWLICDTPTHSLPKYFTSGKLQSSSECHVTVSTSMLLEAFRQFKSSWSNEGVEERNVEELKKLLRQKDAKISEILEVNEQWRLECSELKESILLLESNQIPPIDENEMEALFTSRNRQAMEKISELEKQLRESVRDGDYQLMLEEKRQMSDQLLKVTQERDILVSQLSQLQTEHDQLKVSNQSLLAEFETVKNNREEQANYIEELKDQLSNLRLNLKSKEPSVREMSILLETNRKLTEELSSIQTELKEEKVASSDRLSRAERAMSECRVKLEKEKNELKKSLTTTKDELLALRTYMADLQKQEKRSQQMILPNQLSPKITPTSHPKEISSGHGVVSFSSQQRQCPICANVFPEMSDKEFRKHVAKCFQ